MIEMHQGGESLESHDETAPAPVRPAAPIRILRLAFGNAGMGIAAVVLGFASLGSVQDGTELGDTRYFISHSINEANLVVYRTSSLVRLVIAAIALLLGLVAAWRIFDADDVADDEDIEALAPDPLWVKGVVGAGTLVALVAVAGAAITYFYALHAHATPINP